MEYVVIVTAGEHNSACLQAAERADKQLSKSRHLEAMFVNENGADYLKSLFAVVQVVRSLVNFNLERILSFAGTGKHAK